MNRIVIPILCLLIMTSALPAASAAGIEECGRYDVRLHDPDGTPSTEPVYLADDGSEVVILVEPTASEWGATVTADVDCAANATVSTAQCVIDEVLDRVNLDLGKVPEPVRTFVDAHSPLLGEHGKTIEELFGPQDDDPPVVQQIKGCLSR